MRKLNLGILSRFAVAVGLFTTIMADAAFSQNDTSTSHLVLKEQIKQRLRVNDCEIAPLAIQQDLDSTLRIRTTIDGVPSIIRMSPATARSANYQLLVQVADGSLIPTVPSPERSFRGVIEDQPGVVVGGSWLDDGFYGMALMPDGSKHWIQPVASVVSGVSPTENLHVVFKGADILPCDRVCGVTDEQGKVHPINPHQTQALLGGVGINTSSESLCVAQIAIDADYEYFLAYGTVSATEARINAVMNAVNTQYASQAGITHEITAIIVRSAEPDPYTSNDADTLLDEFGNQWDSNHTGITRDIAHLFTGKSLLGSTIGLAWIGTICRPNTYGYGLHEGTFSGSFACVTDVCAHELGHNWDCGHCACPTSTMNPSSTCTNSFNAGSISEITNFRNSIGCLDCGSLYDFVFQVSGDSVADRMGESVVLGDVTGDGVPDLVVGGSLDDENGTNAGKVRVFNGTNGALLWSKLGQAPGDRYGFSVAISGGRVIVGAPYNDAKATNAGRAYVYNGATGLGVRTYNGAATGDLFGISVAGGKDLNNDGTDDILVAAPLNNLNGIDAGAVYLYSGATFGLLKRLTGETAGERFGWSVAMLGKINSDNNADFIVGAPYNDQQANNAGKIYIYSGSNHALLTSKLGQAAGDQYGRVVASAGSVNTDPRADYAVGAPYADPGGRLNAGRTYVYNGLSHGQLWIKDGVTAGDRLGSSISIAGNANGDSHGDVLIGAPYQDAGGSNSGCAYVCSGINGATLFTLTGQTAGDLAGAAVAGWAGEGIDRIAVAAPLRNVPNSDAGAAFVFDTLTGANSSDSPGVAASNGSVFCAADIAGDDRRVNADDLLSVINHWAQCASPCVSGCPGDVTRNCAVDHHDLIAVINAWGDCP